ncbi:fungal-specific transcription factor domain-containing protein [Aspergillus californicus]
MNSPAQVCARCARIKQRCDGGEPCSRCARLGYTCEAQTRGNEHRIERTQRRPRASRSRAGCLSCKRRKKKCDEVRPRCADCRRLNLPCHWWSRSLGSGSGSELEGQSQGVIPDPSSSADTVTPSSDQVATPSSESGSAASDLAFRSDIETWSADMHVVAVPVASPGGSNPYLHNDEDRSLFNHYLHIVARALSRSNDSDTAGNPFLTALVPMAAVSDTLTSVLLGLSGCHWRRVYPGIWKRALARQGRALSQVNKLLARRDGPYPYTLEACATVLLLCLTELCDGTSRVWKWHLKAARTLLASTTNAELTPEGTFCLSLFHYLDSMSTISRCKPPLLHEGQGTSIADLSIPNPDPLPNSTSTTMEDAITGVVPALLNLLGMVNLLASQRSRRIDELSDLGFRTAAAQVQMRLDSWRAAYDASLATLEEQVNKDANSATTAFEWAIRLRLHQIVNGYDPYHDDVEAALERILQAVLSIPYGSPVEGSLLFPLVIAGASSTVMERRMVVKERLMVMENTLGFGHIGRARELLETVWAGSQDEGGGWNWARVRYMKFPGVVFI